MDRKHSLWRRLFRGVRRGWERLRAEDDAPPRAEGAHAASAFAHAPLHLTLDEMLQTEPGRYFTELHVISLAAFRAAVADQWPKLAEKVLLIGESVIHRHIGPHGVFGRRGDDMFVLVFSGIDEAEAAERAETISTELGERLLGTTRFSAGGLVHVAHLKASAALANGGEIDLDMLRHAVGEARETAARGTPAPLRRHLLPSAKPSLAEQRRVFHGMRESVCVPDEVAGAHEEAGAALTLAYVPTWVAAEAALAATLCRVRRTDPAGREWLGAHAYLNPSLGFAIDRQVAVLVAETLPQSRTALILPVAYTSLVTRQRLLLTEIYDGIPQALRLLRLDFEVFGVPANASQVQLTDVAAALRHLGRSLLLRADPGQDVAALAAECGFDGIGIDLAMHHTGRDAAALATLLADLRRNASAAGLAAHAWNLPGRAAVTAAVAAGIDRLNGKALAPPAERPGAALPVPREHLLKG